MTRCVDWSSLGGVLMGKRLSDIPSLLVMVCLGARISKEMREDMCSQRHFKREKLVVMEWVHSRGHTFLKRMALFTFNKD